MLMVSDMTQKPAPSKSMIPTATAGVGAGNAGGTMVPEAENPQLPAIVSSVKARPSSLSSAEAEMDSQLRLDSRGVQVAPESFVT